jgi:hypothetical protein
LGIGFDTEKLEWFIANEKANDLQRTVDGFLEKSACTLTEIQILHGKLSAFAQMSDFLLGFRFHLTSLLRKFSDGEAKKKLIPAALKDDLWVWKKMIEAAKGGLPLGGFFEIPPLFPKTFISDAAGAAFTWEGETCRNITTPGDRGVAAVGYEKGEVTSVGILRWPHHLLTGAKAQSGAYMGTKSGTLEMVGLLIPFLTRPRTVAGHHVLLGVDNTSVVYAWTKRYCKRDPETSLLIRVLHVIEAFLCCKIYVTHVKRMSTDMAVLADHLSRETTITPADYEAVSHVEIDRPWGRLGKWLEDPVLNWNLPSLILEDVKSIMEK